MLISSPVNSQAFSFANENETVPIKIDSKEDIANTSYKINIVLGDGQIIKTLSSPPYEYDWNPGIAADYSIVASLVDANGNIISSSNKSSLLWNIQAALQILQIVRHQVLQQL